MAEPRIDPTPSASADPVRTEPCLKRVRAFLDGSLVVDTTRGELVWEIPNYPTYYFPVDDVQAQLIPTGDTQRSPSLGDGDVYDVKAGNSCAKGAARRYAGSPVERLRVLVRIDWRSMSEWLEEDEPVYTHARDPHTRVDILASSRHIRVEIDGVTVAESHQPRILFETGLPPRYYLPLTDLRMGVLQPSTRETRCPYKGTATYWSVDTGKRVHEDVVWMYRSPLPESQKIAGLACFYNERVDLYVDGVLMERP